MGTTSESLAFDRGVRPMLEIVLPEKADAVLGFQADPELQARIEELASKSTEGDLTEDERAEYVGYVRANKFVAILKRQALQMADSRHRCSMRRSEQQGIYVVGKSPTGRTTIRVLNINSDDQVSLRSS